MRTAYCSGKPLQKGVITAKNRNRISSRPRDTAAEIVLLVLERISEIYNTAPIIAYERPKDRFLAVRFVKALFDLFFSIRFFLPIPHRDRLYRSRCINNFSRIVANDNFVPVSSELFFRLHTKSFLILFFNGRFLPIR